MQANYSIGLMSGTSLDGVDLVYVSFLENNRFQILEAETFSYSTEWLSRLKKCAELPKADPLLQKWDIALGQEYGRMVADFIKSYGIKKVSLVASHGHTVHHQPEKGYTLQIGAGQEIYQQVKIPVVYDFRTQDVVLGGQGAPLVPIGDELLFSEYDYCLNLGGFSNISYRQHGKRVAFDCCPVNTVLNKYANKLGMPYDDKGEVAKSGSVDVELLEKLNSLEYYQQKAPKSLGIEFVNAQVIPLIEKRELEVKDVLRTFTEHIAVQLASVVHQGAVLVTGGGAYHQFLMELLRAKRTEVCWVLPDKKLIDYKEALIFALLGKLRYEQKVNCLKSVTGAFKDHSSGKIAGLFN